jgi:KDEL-tailed cysteine endopeptidase
VELECHSFTHFTKYIVADQLSHFVSMGFPNFYLVLILTILVALASQAAARTLQKAPMSERHEEWMARYGIVYKDINESQKRYKIFEENVALIDASNRDANKAYKLRLNQFADLTNEEFKASRNRFKGHICSTKTISFKYENATAVPSTMDWRKKGAVTPIKDQGQCGKYQILFIKHF